MPLRVRTYTSSVPDKYSIFPGILISKLSRGTKISFVRQVNNLFIKNNKGLLVAARVVLGMPR